MSFDEIIINLQQMEVVACLESATEPLYESQVMRVAFPDIRLSVSDSLQMFQYHFVLFHYLYELQSTYADQGQYLYIHFMRIYLTDYPADGLCRYYDETFCRFCGDIGESGYCDIHRKGIGFAELEKISDRYFYKDKNNFEILNVETADAFINGAWEILSNFTMYKESFKVLGLSDQATILEIRKRFYFLAKETHPDVGGCNESRFIAINNAYQFLMKVVSADFKKN